MSEQELVDIPFDEIVHQTTKATLFDVGDEEVWLPKSEIREIDEAEKHVTIPVWLATEKGLV